MPPLSTFQGKERAGMNGYSENPRGSPPDEGASLSLLVHARSGGETEDYHTISCPEPEYMTRTHLMGTAYHKCLRNMTCTWLLFAISYAELSKSN